MSKWKQLALKYKPELLYLAFGVGTTLINIFSYYCFYRILRVPNVPSTAIAWLLSVLFSYWTNRTWAFPHKAHGPKNILREMARYLGVRVLTGVLDIVIMFVAVDCMHWNSVLWKVISNIIVIVINYVACKVLVFSHRWEDEE